MPVIDLAQFARGGTIHGDGIPRPYLPQVKNALGRRGCVCCLFGAQSGVLKRRRKILAAPHFGFRSRRVLRLLHLLLTRSFRAQQLFLVLDRSINRPLMNNLRGNRRTRC